MAQNDSPSLAGCFGSVVVLTLLAYLFIPPARAKMNESLAEANKNVIQEGFAKFIGAVETTGVTSPRGIVLACICVLMVAVGVFFLRVAVAKSTAIKNRRKSIDCFWGFVRLILWEQNEGLMFLNNKRTDYFVYGNRIGGGVRLIYPWLGQEMRLRVPLTEQQTDFRDDNVLTHESILVKIRVSIRWKVVDIERYFYVMGERVAVRGELGKSIVEDQEGDKPEIAQRWILTDVESSLRTLVSNLSVSSLISLNPVCYLTADSRISSLNGSSGSTGSAQTMHSELADKLRSASMAKVAKYGLHIETIEIQEVALLPEIQGAINRIYTMSLNPAMTQLEAHSRRIQFEEDKAILGSKYASLIAVAKALPSHNGSGTLHKFIDEALSSTGTTGDGRENRQPTESARITQGLGRYVGEIFKILEEKQIGFIRSRHFNDDLFFHWTDLDGLQFDELRLGQRVTFEIGQNFDQKRNETRKCSKKVRRA